MDVLSTGKTCRNTDLQSTSMDVVSVERCLIQEMKSSLASSLTSSMLITDQ